MKILTTDKSVKERETEALFAKRVEEERRTKEWEDFKNTLWYERVMKVLDEEIVAANTISLLPNLHQASDFEELGGIVAAQRKVVLHLERVRQRFLTTG